ncbi:hypothetical protein P3X46_015282 [Hevea brasiliensis]|uniref:Cupin type-1 domain-containing protein n=1 Tax=Hevea brasiliensis TaxID=3981 RepID=A0ABQ9LVE7_HEVBR|nr:hypothetical protein P3X46_015282 [Hevea brasiliensis]
MAVREKLFFFYLFYSFPFCFSAGLSLATRDPELRQCKHRFEHQRQNDEDQKEECMDLCEVKTEHGRINVLQKFTKESKLLLHGIENYRIAILEADPQSFVAPSHWDADAVIFVAKVIGVRAGTPVYFINRDENEKLFIVKRLRPAFRAAGGEDQESFYRAFSWELLEAALKTERKRLERIIKQNQDFITKASKEQIQSMSHREEGSGIWPFGGESSGPFNLLHKRPVQSNNYGQLLEVDHNDYHQLKDFDLTVSFANVSRGSMIGPYYNSKATKISIVVDGEGYFEMACPHVSSSSKRKKTSSPAGHPVASVASRNNNLQILCFEINTKGKNRYPLAGRNNVVKKMETEAKELAFGVPAREVEHVFGNQQDQWFFPGPRQHRKGGYADA